MTTWSTVSELQQTQRGEMCTLPTKQGPDMQRGEEQWGYMSTKRPTKGLEVMVDENPPGNQRKDG